KAARLDASMSIDFFRHYRVCFWITLLCCTVGACVITGIQGDLVDGFCRFMNENFKKLTIEPVASYVKLSALGDVYPGVPQPVTLTVLASPTLLGWYGYYKFSVEEELYQQELREKGRVSGCRGYGTLLPFVFLFLFGAAASLAGLEAVSAPCLQLVGLRQVHFLSRYWADVRGGVGGEEAAIDKIAELFPFISSPRFTLKEFITQPRRWFWFTKDYADFDFDRIEE
ncbi:hypothetical protein B484DRAFT_402682, partial [Ochromonadaceae sp. CCMP2298]